LGWNALDGHQKQARPAAGVFCKQIAIIGVRAEAGLLDFKDADEIALLDGPYGKAPGHICYSQ
jgi:hypothetical protein